MGTALRLSSLYYNKKIREAESMGRTGVTEGLDHNLYLVNPLLESLDRFTAVIVSKKCGGLIVELCITVVL